MQGNRIWHDTLTKLRANPGDFRLVLELRSAKNYEHGDHCCSWCYDPLRFDIDEARTRVHAALASRASSRKVFGHVFGIPAFFRDPLSDALEILTMSVGTRVIHSGHHSLGLESPQPVSHTPSQTDSETRGADSQAQALCEQCGSPHGLKRCSKCKAVSYCSPR